MVTDLKQVAERLRKVRIQEEVPNEVYGIDFSGSRLPEAALTVNALISTDVDLACDDWLAERDPTPLTVEVLKRFGAKDDYLGMYFRKSENFTLSLFENCDGNGAWGCANGWLPPIRTVGELRTLARLAGVELKC